MKKWLVLLAGAIVTASIAELAHLQLLAALWIPLAMLLFLLAFPPVVVLGKSSLLWGLFDLDLSPRLRLPIRHYFATLSVFTVGGSALCILHIVLLGGHERFDLTVPRFWPSVSDALLHLRSGNSSALLLIGLCAISVWFMAFALATSWSQDKSRSLVRMIAGVVLALLTGAAGTWLVLHDGIGVIDWAAQKTAGSALAAWLGPGYQEHWGAHIAAMLAVVLSLALYAGLGIYGRLVLGRDKMVAALIGPLMAILVLGWAGSGAQFFLGRWHIPLLLVVAVFGCINGLLPWTDHTYALLQRNGTPAAPPYEVLTAGGRRCAILVAAAGGGIQAAAWTSKVLQELHSSSFGEQFDRALCLISSISGGSTGTACYVDWVNRGAPGSAVLPFDAASASSLDEVSWGLAWPDLLRVLLPIPIAIDRGLALEKAWIGNSGSTSMNAALSDWNAATGRGNLPAAIMNSTMVEVGGPLLLGTSDVNGAQTRKSSCWWDGDKLHMDGEKELDIPVVRAARLSATFPFVTPAARPVKANHEPHMMDGGFYDNYGMATLTEWIDQALEEQASRGIPESRQIQRVLVLQVNGFPPADFTPPKPPEGRGGWVMQLIDPVKILVNVRSAGQVSHREVEMELLRDKWHARGISIEDVHFELQNPDAPLSWHLMPKQKAAVADAWNTDQKVLKARQKVEQFLNACPLSAEKSVEPLEETATGATASA